MHFRRLRDIREDRDYSQKDIGEILGCSGQNYGRFENGKVLISISSLYTLSKHYQLSSDYLLELTNDNSTIIMKNSEFNYKMLINKLIQSRKDNNYTQEYLAKYLNITQSTYSRIERNVYRLDVEALIKLSKLYNISVDELLGIK